MSKTVNMTKLSSSKVTNKNLLQLTPGSYFRLAENQRTMIKEETTGLIVSSFWDEISGEPTYRVVLVEGDLLLVPEGDPCLKIPKK